MENIFIPDNNFKFTNNITLGTPYSIYKGPYFTKLFHNNSPLFIQIPKCVTKQGFIKNKKKTICDLLFTNNDDIFINWLENLESTCINFLYEKGEHWFESKMEKVDIENVFTSSLKPYKGGKFYSLKANVKNQIKIYDENHSIISIDTITPENNILAILEINGIEFTSHNFQLEFEMKQVMVVSPDPFLDECFIKRDKYYKKPDTNNSLQNVMEQKQEPLNITSNNNVTLNKNITDTTNINTGDNTEDDNIFGDKYNDNDVETCSNLVETSINLDINDIEDTLVDLLNGDLNDITDIDNDNDNNNDDKIRVKFSEDTIDNEPLSFKNLDINGDNDENIKIDFEDLDNNDNYIKTEDIPISNINMNYNINNIGDNGIIKLKEPAVVYMDAYNKIKEKIFQHKQELIYSILEAKNIKNKFLPNNFIDDDEKNFTTFNI